MKERIKKVRKHYGLTLKDMEKRVGITFQTLSAVERGATPVQERHVRLILSAFPEISETWLRTGEGEMFEIPQPDRVDELVQEYGFPQIVGTLLSTFDRLPEEKQAVVLEYARGVIADMIRKDAELTAAEVLASDSKEDGDREEDIRTYISSRIREDIKEDGEKQA